jgi:hypothetical protein
VLRLCSRCVGFLLCERRWELQDNNQADKATPRVPNLVSTFFIISFSIGLTFIAAPRFSKTASAALF